MPSFDNRLSRNDKIEICCKRLQPIPACRNRWKALWVDEKFWVISNFDCFRLCFNFIFTLIIIIYSLPRTKFFSKAFFEFSAHCRYMSLFGYLVAIWVPGGFQKSKVSILVSKIIFYWILSKMRTQIVAFSLRQKWCHYLGMWHYLGWFSMTQNKNICQF